MLTKSINFKNFKVNKVNKVNQKIDKDFKILIKEKSTLLQSLGTTYKNIYTKKIILRIKKYSNGTDMVIRTLLVMITIENKP